MASSGIGVDIARILADEQAKLVLAARTREKLQQVADSLPKTEPLVVPTDVTVEQECQALAQAAQAEFGTIDVLVNNAGYGPPANIQDTTESLWDVTVNTCLKSVYLMTRAVIDVMIEKGQGRVVNISSQAGLYGYKNRSAYCAAKWGVQGFTAALRAEFEGQNIRFHNICPGVVATPWWDNVGDSQDEEILAGMIQPEEVAQAVHYVLTQPDRIQIDDIAIKPHISPWEAQGVSR